MPPVIRCPQCGARGPALTASLTRWASVLSASLASPSPHESRRGGAGTGGSPPYSLWQSAAPVYSPTTYRDCGKCSGA